VVIYIVKRFYVRLSKGLAAGRDTVADKDIDNRFGGPCRTNAFILYGSGVDLASGREIVIITVAGFILFRLFDIIKPWPCKKLEKLPAGWGILADDLMAGFYAAIVLMIGLKFV